MKQMSTLIKHAMTAVILVLLFAGCQKTEFMPPPEGEKIVYNPSVTKNLTALLSESPNKLFYAAWQRSTIDDAQLKTNLSYTLLVPSDAAMQSAGYTADAISKMAVNDVDSLVAYYTIKTKITKENLLLRTSNYEGISLQPRADLVTREGPANYRAQYYYRHFVGADNGKLLINGVISGNAAAAVEATNGNIFPIDRLIPVPTRSFSGALEDDPRFSMFLEVQRRADQEHNKRYNEIYLEYYGFEPGDDYRRNYYIANFSIMPGQPVLFNMMFAPTNEAFEAAGFNSVEDVIEWNKRAAPMVFNENTGEPTEARYPSDTLFSYHWDFGRANTAAPKPTIFYSNDLRNDLLGNYLINYDAFLTYYMPYEFSKRADGKVQVKVKGSTTEAATVLETINTLMGPVHVIDRLLVPKDFKLK